MRAWALCVVVMVFSGLAGCGASHGRGEPPVDEPNGGSGVDDANDSRGTSTGNPNDGTPPLVDEPAPGGFCSGGTETRVALDAQTDLGFSAADILAFAEGTHEAPIRWNPHNEFTTLPASGQTTLTVTITSDRGDARYRPTRDIAIGDQTAHCPGSLRIDVGVQVQSEDGALDERASGTLLAYGPREATLWLPIATADLAGSLAVEAKGEYREFAFTGLFVSIVLSEFGLNGLVSAQFDSDTPEASARAVLEGVAEFGLDACTRGGFAIGAGDEVDGLSADDLFGFIANHAELDVQWSDDTTSLASVAFTAEREVACLILDEPWSNDSILFARGRLSLRTQDGRVDGSWPVLLHGMLDAQHRVAGAQFELDPDGELPPATVDNLASVYGLPLADAAGYDRLSFSLSLSIYADAGPTMGELRLQGLTDRPCTTPTGQPLPTSEVATGCADAVDLLAASFLAR